MRIYAKNFQWLATLLSNLLKLAEGDELCSEGIPTVYLIKKASDMRNVFKMGAEQAKLLDAGEKLTEQLQEISKRMEEVSKQNEKLLTEKKELEELRQLKGATPKQAASQVQIANMSEFDLKYKWSHWYERFEFFCKVNNISQEKKMPLFLMMIGNEGYSLLKNLCAPEDPKSKSFKELSKIMEDHLEPERNVITERYNFKERRQTDQEGIKDYIASLKSLAIKCNFENLDSCLRDQFVWGLRNNAIKKRLLNEVNLTFKRAVEIATLLEGGAENSIDMNYNKDKVSNVNINKNLKTQPKNKITCYCCGKANHTRNNCPFKNDKCNLCGSIGHLQVLCQRKRFIRDNNSSNKNSDKSTSGGNGNIQNNCMRQCVEDESEDSFHLNKRSGMFDRDEINNCSSISNLSSWESFMSNKETATSSTTITPRSSILNNCCYCQAPIQNIDEIFQLMCKHMAHKSCYENFSRLIRCHVCNSKEY